MIKLKKSKDGQFYFVVVAKNYKVIATSEMYKTKQACTKGVIALLTATKTYKW